MAKFGKQILIRRSFDRQEHLELGCAEDRGVDLAAQPRDVIRAERDSPQLAPGRALPRCLPPVAAYRCGRMKAPTQLI
jgi:hypothetical protein